MNLASIYIPIDRRRAIAQEEALPDRTTGSALFADISGFTPLTTALLNELGLKRGPEELTRQLNLVYDALVNQVHLYGGSVLGFAGDAITCWFDGDDGARATACGLEMQQAMAQFSAITTPAGTVISLGMKAAVAAGPVRRFLVGDPAIQTIDALAGETLERMASAEHQAERGDVVVSPEVVERLGDLLIVSEVRKDNETGVEYSVISALTQTVPPAPWPEISPDEEITEAQARSWVIGPVFERLKGGQDQFLAEIRPVVALFLRFGGFDFDEDDLAGEKLDVYIRWVQSILAQHNGNMLQLTIGDKGCYLYASFGAPITHGNDPVQAVAAALALKTAPARVSFVGQVQLGISQGRMRTGAYGGQARSTYGVLGDEVNMAARLMQLAPPGQIMVSQPIADAVSDAYQLEYLGPTKVKGKEDPIPVYQIQRRRKQVARKPVHVFPSPLVGREAELAQMAKVLTLAMAGQGQILRVQGVAGIGKSHLLSEFAQQSLLQGWRVVLGACQSSGIDIPYHPWRQIFRSLLVLLDDEGADESAQIAQVRNTILEINPNWEVRLPLLSDLLNLPIPDNATTATFEPQLRQEALFTFAIDLITVWAQYQPLLILVEDIHWQDEASRGLTLALARVAKQLPITLLVAHRPPLERNQPIMPQLDTLDGYNLLDLAELSPKGVGALVTFKLQGQASPLLLDLIQTQALGNPFFVEELIDTLRTLGHLRQRSTGQWDLSEPIINALRQANCLSADEAGNVILNPAVPLSAADMGLPDSIQGLVLARLDRMLEAHKLTIKVASVIGRIFQFQLLSQAHPTHPDEESLLTQVEEIEEREFARLEVPMPTLTHIFKHNITRDVAYETLLESQQRELHLAVAQAIEAEAGEAIELLAYHYNQAQVSDKAMYYLDLAARKAQHDFANQTALTYYRQAMVWEDRWQWRKGEIEVLHLLARRKEELEALQQLQAIADVPAFEIAYLWGQYYEAIANYPQAQTAIEKALVAAQQNGESLAEIRCLGQLGLIARRQGDYAQAKEKYEQALNNYDEQTDYSAEQAFAYAQMLNGLGIVYRQQGAFNQARSYYVQALALSRAKGNLQLEAEVLSSLGVTAYYQRKLIQALKFHHNALEIRKTIGNRARQGASLYNIALIVQETGNYSEALSNFQEALVIQKAIGNRWEEVNIWNGLGILYQEIGNLAEANTCLQQGFELAKEIGDEAGRAYIMSNWGLVMRDQQNMSLAEQILREGLNIFQKENNEYEMSFFLSYLSTVNLQTGNLSIAIEQAQASLSYRKKLDMKLNLADDLATLGAIYLAESNIAEAINNAEQALFILDGCNGQGPEFPQRDYFICYQILEADNQPDKAQQALQSAYNLVMTRANNITDPALRQSFLENVSINRQIVEAYQEPQS